ncbi:FHA domain-containing protein [Paenibacillus cymbidii]|uniref:FHA domain-containing protein n=1 Tax=Paenibacillus cymbidii TaxID=1639034 RepID=UPI00108001EF|nr:FHA domain-containing protein [Paenibacillus cymbidii]
MKRCLYGLQVEYVRQVGRYVVVTGEQPLTEDDLVPLEHKMLQLHAVPRLLPIEFEAIHSELALRYSLSGFRPLAEALRAEPPTLVRAVRLLYTIVTAIADSAMYMLSANRYALHEALLYAGDDLCDVRFVYLPLRQLDGKDDVQNELRRLCRRLIGDAPDGAAGGNRLNRLLDYMKSDTFHLEGCKEQLLAVWEELERSENETEPAAAAAGFAASAPPRPYANDSGVAASSLSHRASEPAEPGRAKKTPLPILPAAAALILLLAAVWLLYSRQKSEGMLQLAAGLSLLIAAGMYLLVQSGRAAAAASYFHPIAAVAPPASAASPPHPDRLPQAGTSADDPDDSAAIAEHYRRLPQLTTVLAASPGTELLAPADEERGHPYEGIRAALVRIRNPAADSQADEEEEEIAIRGESFIIGRSREEAHYWLDEIGVSRKHVEIFAESGRHLIRDLGSRNSSYLNGSRLVPFDEYVLCDSDRIELARVELVYRDLTGRT